LAMPQVSIITISAAKGRLALRTRGCTRGRPAFVMGLLIAIFGAIFAGAAAVKMLRMADAQSRGLRAVGRVVRLEVVPDPVDQSTYAPVVEFEAEGRRVWVQGWRSRPPGEESGGEGGRLCAS